MDQAWETAEQQFFFRESQRIEHKSISRFLNDSQVVPYPLSKASVRL
jgi:hypothetical protein